MLDFVVCVGGIYACFLTWSMLQERVLTATYGEDRQRFRFTIVLNALQAVAAAAVGYVYIRVVQRRAMPAMTKRRWARFFQVALLGSLSSPFGYMALRYINYPTMTLAKTCKMVPVLLMNKVLYRRHYPGHKYLVVAMVTAGVSAFMLFNGSGKAAAAESSLYGLLLVLVNLMFDGAVNSTQDQVFAEDKEISGQHMMCLVNVCSSLLMAAWLLNPLNPELPGAVRFLRTHPRAMVDIGLFAMCGALGQCFIFYTLATFGSLTLTTVTVTRKFLTILVSVLINGHQLDARQWAATGLVFAGISFDVYKKQAAKPAAAPMPEKPLPQDTAAASSDDDSDELVARTESELVALQARISGQDARKAALRTVRQRRLVDVAAS
ncbi:UDP-galactose transporter [Coemansia nantahalensis]|uniref:UDP-galactose transporter n=1 Tax=Coemansia nantahalensis TaxID=2789366 RepID=A0ACC1K052_9FUNG|nr:UDP-galactose transporter [Coemansia nantahalensis]